jgi:hypothetical protein
MSSKEFREFARECARWAEESGCFYVSPDLVGIVSHGGTRTHSHWVALDGNSTAQREILATGVLFFECVFSSR